MSNIHIRVSQIQAAAINFFIFFLSTLSQFSKKDILTNDITMHYNAIALVLQDRSDLKNQPMLSNIQFS